MITRIQIQQACEYFEKAAGVAEQKLQSLPKGKLRWCLDKGQARYFMGKSSINRNPDLVKSLVEREFWEREREIATNNEKILAAALDEFTDWDTELLLEDLRKKYPHLPEEYLFPGCTIDKRLGQNLNSRRKRTRKTGKAKSESTSFNQGKGKSESAGFNQGKGCPRTGNREFYNEVLTRISSGSQPQIVSGGPGTVWIISDLPFAFGERYLTKLEMEAWANADYVKLVDDGKRLDNHKQSKGKETSTTFGLVMRSKSEAMIAEFLHYHGVSFRYEPEIKLGDKVFHPDFLIIRKDGSVVIIEHFGIMSDREYERDSIEKMRYYMLWGISPWTCFIPSYETWDKSVDLNLLKMQLQRLGVIE